MMKIPQEVFKILQTVVEVIFVAWPTTGNRVSSPSFRYTACLFISVAAVFRRAGLYGLNFLLIVKIERESYV